MARVVFGTGGPVMAYLATALLVTVLVVGVAVIVVAFPLVVAGAVFVLFVAMMAFLFTPILFR